MIVSGAGILPASSIIFTQISFVQKIQIHVITETMNCQRNLRQYLTLILAFFAMPQTFALAEPGATSSISPQQITIDSLKANEIFPTDKKKVNSSQELDSPPDFNRAIVRPVEWQMRVSKAQLKLPLEVEYELKSNNNAQSNQFSTDASANAILGVIIQKSENTVSDDSDPNVSVVRGKVTLQFDPLKAGVAGAYKGRLLVCVKDTNNGCI